jgi:hypothetical protein
MFKKNKEAKLVLCFFTATVITYLILGALDQSWINEVEFEVVYGGSFNVTIAENGDVKTNSMYGLGKVSLIRVGRDLWILEATVQKLDSDDDTLYVYFKDKNGEMLATDSTNEAFGIANINLVL